MDYYFLDQVSWEHSQAIYHAAAYLQREALFILRPATPYVCIGCHQNARLVIDLEYTEEQGIPVFRREVGGGAVFLDGNQLFYQLVLRSDHPQVPPKKADFYRKYLEPVVQTYRAFGVDAVYKPVNDILYQHQKISGNGAAEINDMVILVGNFILDFDYQTMSQCLRVPDEKFRDKVYKTLQENLTTIKHVTGKIPDTELIAEDLIGRYIPLLGSHPIQYQADDQLLAKADEIFARMHTDDWLFENDNRIAEESVKIREGVYVIQQAYKAPGGLIQVSAVKEDGILRDVHLSGDFFFYPAEDLVGLEDALENLPADQEVIREAIQEYYLEYNIESP
ncbi:MAG: lipoate--protein ligase, partial [Anaerolineales bacterium]